MPQIIPMRLRTLHCNFGRHRYFDIPLPAAHADALYEDAWDRLTPARLKQLLDEV